MSDDEETRESAEWALRRVKIQALKEGELTNFTFLVGPSGGHTEELRCFRSDLMMASQYFRDMFSRFKCLDWTRPCRIYTEPHIFKIILKFLTTTHLEELSSIEDAVSLALAAKEFSLEDMLMPFCKFSIKKMVRVDNVWKNLNNCAKCPQIQAAFSEFLTIWTRDCLKHSSFLEASQESVIFLLQLPALKVDSEKELLDACFKLANSKTPKAAGDKLMRTLLPHLRLLTLEVHEIEPELLDLLTNPEKVSLLCEISSIKMSLKDKPLPKILNPNIIPRDTLLYLGSPPRKRRRTSAQKPNLELDF